MKKKIFNNIRVCSTVWYGERLHFRSIPPEQISEDLVGFTIVIFSEKWSKFPAGVLLDVHNKYIRIKSPTTGQILHINFDIIKGFNLLAEFLADLRNEDFQNNPQKYTINYKP